MKTSATMGRQEARKEAEQTGAKGTHNSAPVSAKYDHRIDAERLRPFQWKPGQTGNPGGRPKVDLASEIAKAIFENDGPAIYAAFSKMLRKGSPYAFQVLSDRAFGKLKDRHEVDIGPYLDLSDADLAKRIYELETKVGVPHSEPELLPPADSDSTKKPN